MLTNDEARQALHQLSLALDGWLPSKRREGCTWLDRLTAADLVRLDDAARGTNDGRGPAVGGKPDPAEKTGLGAILASMHYDGFLREKALPQLSGEAGAALLALRTADHVPQVRERATALLLSGQYSDIRVLGVLLAIRRRLHAGDLVEHYANRLTAGKFASLRSSDERALRRWAYQRGLDQLTTPELEAGAVDNDQWLRALCADALAQRADADLAGRLLSSKYVETRMAAVMRLPDELLSDAEVLRALFDRSARVRELAQWRWRRRGGSPAQTYRATDQRLDARVHGLIATGGPEDLEFVAAQLADRRPAVRVAAAKAVAAWTEGEERARILGPLLLDSSSKVVGAVVPGLAELPRATTAGALAAALSSDQPWSRRGAMRLKLHRESWHALEVILQLRTDRDPELATLAHATLTTWLRSSAAAGQRLPDEDQKERLRTLLAGAGLDDSTTRQVAFYARL